MANKAIDHGRSFLTKVLEKIPAEARADVQKHLENDGVLETLGTGVLARADYSRGMAQVQSDHQRLDAWYREHLPVLEAGKKALANGGRRPAADDDDDDLAPDAGRRREPAIDPSLYVPREEATATLARMAEQNMQLTAMVSRITLNHFKEFGEVLDPTVLFTEAQERQLRLDLAYDAMVSDRRSERAKVEREAEIKKAREEGELAGRAAAAGAQLPHITGNPEITTMDGLRTDNRPEVGLSAALRTFHEESAKASAAGR